jgi:phosphoribosylanthranilate isomerase
MEVKICGVCRPEDAACAVAAGADAVGVVLAPGLARSLALDEAAAVLAEAGALLRVGIFVDAAAGEVAATALRLGLDAVQLHGAEAPAAVAAVRAAGPWHVRKALRPRSGDEFRTLAAAYAGAADALLVDGWSGTAPGGSGARFPWDEVAAHRAGVALPLHVAGGLMPENVAAVVRLLRPAGVDVSSGVEAAPRRKDPDRVRAFVARARGAAGAAGAAPAASGSDAGAGRRP